MNGMRKMTAVAGAVWLALAAGCARDRAGGDVAGPRGAPTDGSRVSGTIVESLSLPGASGQAAEPRVTRHAFQATVRSGHAEVDGAAVVTSGGLPRPSHEVEFTDREGRRARIVVGTSGAGQPVRRFQVYRDGELLADAAFTWENRTGAWVLTQRTLTVYDRGNPVLRQVRTLEGASTVQAFAGARVGRPLARLLTSAILPNELEAQWYRCLDKAALTIVAASAVGAATAAVITAPTPVTFTALAAAIAFYDRTMDEYVKCIEALL
jgi:hypothetical protein